MKVFAWFMVIWSTGFAIYDAYWAGRMLAESSWWALYFLFFMSVMLGLLVYWIGKLKEIYEEY